ncbi:aminopeptidase N [Desulfococcaceae bacterium HSG9]|nr:aminopeptidase N [Desulfococcaceae bacterium HSG9]
MQTQKHCVTSIDDYRPPAYQADHIDLRFELHESMTTVHAVMKIRRNPDVINENAVTDEPLLLNGRETELTALLMDGKSLSQNDYIINQDSLSIHNPPDQFTLEITTRISPETNTSLEGLYLSDGMFCTQCEAEGFRKITYFPDRPDVMARYSCTIIADQERYPVLLSNGNLVDSGIYDDGRHFARWEDPFKKPSYLFALVAGNLVCIQDKFRTCSGREVDLRIYVEPENADKCGHAMQALKKSMKWDETVYGREYDLDIYMIVAVNDFNMGAMENKGLNIFNSQYVLARYETATDDDFLHIEEVIAHEYFHNWTGNRITLKNWFQLSLKEGLTVFRDQQFSTDMNSGVVKRITDVKKLKAFQFPEDAGPMAHPVRPASYININNFYTMTVYNKGAELIRMLFTLLGKEGFRKGTDLYFEKHDGQAVDCDDFITAMQTASGVDLEQMRLWWSQAGTPQVTVDRTYHPDKRILTLTFTQTCPSTPDMPAADKKPFHIPMDLGLLNQSGNDIPLQLENEDKPTDTTHVFNLCKPKTTLNFINVPEAPVPSLLRGFSAPVKLKADYNDEELLFLLANDTDGFNRWEAGQQLFFKRIFGLIRSFKNGTVPKLDDAFIDAVRTALSHKNVDKALIALTLTPPSESELAIRMAEGGQTINVEAIHQVRKSVIRTLAKTLQDLLKQTYRENCLKGAFKADSDSIAHRRLKNMALAYLGHRQSPAMTALIFEQFETANNMTDTMAALKILAGIDCEERHLALDRFYQTWQADTLVLDKWFAVQAASQLPHTLARVRSLMQHPAFSMKNPNKVRALIGVFGHQNHWHFHLYNGSGYKFIADQVLKLDPANPMIAARLVSVFNRWRQYDTKRQEKMCAQLEKIVNTHGLSADVYEIVSKTLAAPSAS